jgi:hypothetical protein
MGGVVMASGNRESRGKGISGLVFVGCLMIGFAAGFLVENIVVGLFCGLGAGFIAMAIARYKTGEW